jgi:hypothetical protein
MIVAQGAHLSSWRLLACLSSRLSACSSWKVYCQLATWLSWTCFFLTSSCTFFCLYIHTSVLFIGLQTKFDFMSMPTPLRNNREAALSLPDHLCCSSLLDSSCPAVDLHFMQRSERSLEGNGAWRNKTSPSSLWRAERSKICSILLWAWWKHRNKINSENVQLDVDGVILSARRCAFFWNKRRGKRLAPHD